MRIKFEKYNGDYNRSIDVVIYGENKNKILEACNYIEENMEEEIYFILDSLEEEELNKYSIIGTLNFNYGFMAEKKLEVKNLFKEFKKIK